MNKLVVLGSVNADHVLQVPSFPRPGETLYGKGYAVIPGGKGANQAVAAARLGADVAFIACVGDDSFGVNIRDAFKSDRINVDGVMIEKNTPTGIAMIQVSATGENSICISAEANDHLTAERIKPFSSLISAAEMLLMQLETPIETIQAAAEMAKLSATVVVLNPAPAQSLSDDLLKLVDIITPNETEAEQLTGIKVKDMPSAQQAAEKLHHKGIETVMITLGSEGVWL
ncbi:MAG: ribokinase, partial [Sphingobacteriales bacterium]